MFNNERDNDIVTISKIQVALLAQGHSVASELSHLSLEVDTGTAAGLFELMQASMSVLLQHAEAWTHVLAHSQTVRSREEAEVEFNRLSVAERSKFSVETLTNVDGQIRQQEPPLGQSDAGDSDYVVVTLLVGTADDRPLFKDIRSADALKTTLEQLQAMREDYLMVFELLWSPQAESDRLTADDLSADYGDLLTI